MKKAKEEKDMKDREAMLAKRKNYQDWKQKMMVIEQKLKEKGKNIEE